MLFTFNTNTRKNNTIAEENFSPQAKSIPLLACMPVYILCWYTIQPLRPSPTLHRTIPFLTPHASWGAHATSYFHVWCSEAEERPIARALSRAEEEEEEGTSEEEESLEVNVLDLYLLSGWEKWGGREAASDEEAERLWCEAEAEEGACNDGE